MQFSKSPWVSTIRSFCRFKRFCLKRVPSKSADCFWWEAVGHHLRISRISRCRRGHLSSRSWEWLGGRRSSSSGTVTSRRLTIFSRRKNKHSRRSGTRIQKDLAQERPLECEKDCSKEFYQSAAQHELFWFLILIVLERILMTRQHFQNWFIQSNQSSWFQYFRKD